jgi:hypothetical protein
MRAVYFDEFGGPLCVAECNQSNVRDKSSI